MHEVLPPDVQRVWISRRLMLRMHREWVDAQKEKGYACPVISFKTRKIIDPGRPPNTNDGIIRH